MPSGPGGYYRPQPPINSNARVPEWIVKASVRVQMVSGAGGSGTVIEIENGSGLVITNRHVAGRDGARATLNFPDGKRVAAETIAVSSDADLAALDFAADHNFPRVSLAEKTPTTSTAIYQVGYPMGQGPVQRSGHTAGMGSYSGRAYNLELRLASYFGDSGSGIFRQSDGRLVAVLWGGANGVSSVAVPVEYCHGFLQKIRERIKARREARRGGQPKNPAMPLPPPGFPQGPSMPSVPPAPPANDGLLAKLKADLEIKIAAIHARSNEAHDRFEALKNKLETAHDKALEAGHKITNLGQRFDGAGEALGKILERQDLGDSKLAKALAIAEKAGHAAEIVGGKLSTIAEIAAKPAAAIGLVSTLTPWGAGLGALMAVLLTGRTIFRGSQRFFGKNITVSKSSTVAAPVPSGPSMIVQPTIKETKTEYVPVNVTDEEGEDYREAHRRLAQLHPQNGTVVSLLQQVESVRQQLTDGKRAAKHMAMGST